jgi:hypothetical protein
MVYGEVFGDVWGKTGSTQGITTSFFRTSIDPIDVESNAYLSGVDDFLFSHTMQGGSIATGVVTPSARIPEANAHVRASAKLRNAYTPSYRPEPTPAQTPQVVQDRDWLKLNRPDKTIVPPGLVAETEFLQPGTVGIYRPTAGFYDDSYDVQPPPVVPQPPVVEQPDSGDGFPGSGVLEDALEGLQGGVKFLTDEIFPLVSPFPTKEKFGLVGKLWNPVLEGSGLPQLSTIFKIGTPTLLIAAAAAVFFLGPSFIRRSL